MPGVIRLVLALALVPALGCATYSDRTLAAREAVTRGDYDGGIKEYNKILGVSSPEELPTNWKAERPLAVLERATLQQARGDLTASARDFGAADQELEFLDLTGDVAGTIGKYIYSDSATVYKTTPTEKLSLNAFNMLNYLAAGNLNGAAVEARRFTVMRNYLLDYEPESAHGAFGSYVAGFVFERMGEPARAMRYYDEALSERQFATLRAPVARLAPRTQHRGPAMARFIEEQVAGFQPPAGDAEILTVVSLGRVPYKVPERMPIGAAVGVAGSFIAGDPAVLGYSVFKFVNYPEMVPSGSLYSDASVSVDGRSAPLELASNLGAEISAEYEDLKPKIIGAALSRMIVRAAAAEGARAAGKSAGGAEGEALGWILALLTEGLLVAADKPDTRSWTMLPHYVLVSRTTVTSGRHTVGIRTKGNIPDTHSVDVDVPPGGFAVVVWTVPR